MVVALGAQVFAVLSEKSSIIPSSFSRPGPHL